MDDNKKIFKQLEEQAKKKWAPSGTWDIKPLDPGFSGAQILKAELIQKGHGALIDDGYYILKLCKAGAWGGDSETSRYIAADRFAARNDPEFFPKHVPKLIENHTIERNGEKYFALLMAVAGQSFYLYQPAEGPENRLFEMAAQAIVEKTMAALMLPEIEIDPLLPHEYLENWIGYRLKESQAVNLHKFVKDITEDRLLFIFGGETLVNPLKLYPFLESNLGHVLSRRPLQGFLHGDLHGGNILLHNALPAEEPFQIIDFGLAVEGYAGFDQAYLETAHCLYNLHDSDPMSLIAILKSIDNGENQLSPTHSARGAWLHKCLLQMRRGWDNWQKKYHPSRKDDLDRQMLLARVAAGINWANKPISAPQKALALAYGAWAARHYLESLEPVLWKTAISGATCSAGEKGAIPLQPHDPQFTDLWRIFWNQVEGFSNLELCYVLVAGGQKSSPELQAYGNIPWSAIIDLDPNSDRSGLYKASEPVIRTRRGLHVLSDAAIIGEFHQATYWLLTGGWQAKGEKPLNYWQWLEHKMPIIDGILGRLKKNFGADKTVLVFVPWLSHEPDRPMDRFSDIANHAFTILGPRAKIILTGNSTLNRKYPNVSHIPIAPNTIALGLAHSFGTAASQISYEIPGTTGMVPIPVEQLRMLQESLFVMHSSILQEDTAPNADQMSGFWTGHPPSWHEINAGIDIRRTITDKIIKRVTEFLKSPPSRTIFITQKPGMGGTTILRRVAWEFHKTHPVTFIERDAPSLPQRLKTLHELAGRSILVIVEGSRLTEARFEEIYNAAFKDNIRSVFIYLRKDFSNFLQPSDKYANPLSLPDPLDEGEAELFLSSFKQLTDDDIRLSELQKITRVEQYQRYRIPFFYGLITFDRDFQGIDHFVQQHLQGLHHRLVGLFQYLAIVTRYSSEYLPASFVNHFLRVDKRLQLLDILPEGPYRLIISLGNKLRLLHPLIAEQVLEALEPGGSGDRWIQSLYSLSIDLIGRLHEYSSELNQEIQDLLIALFINRQGAPLTHSEQETFSASTMEVTGAEDIYSQPAPDESHHTETVSVEETTEEEREGFSPIIMKMISVHKHQGRQVFDELVEKYPDDPHLWNHRGRYYMYVINDLSIAEKSLLEAIDRSGSIDHVHFHTYGLVKKHQIFRQLRGFANTVTPQQVFQAIGPDYLAAEQAFLDARKLNPESVYSYISHIQMILGVLNRIRRLSNYQDLAQTDPTTQRLIMDRIGQVNDMLDSIHQIYLSSSKQRSYLLQIEASLKEFYGDLGGVIRLWEKVLASGSVTHHARRALCKAYLARKEGNWARLEMVELRRMKSICEENLTGPHWRDNDVLWWFQASIRLSGQDRKSLIAKLSDWLPRPLWSVGYLLSILHFLEWLDRREGAEREFQNAIERCRELVYGRKRFCRFYLGTGAGELPLVDEFDLEREKQNRWFVDDQAIKRLNGLISEDIPSGDRPPHIVIEGAFHVPFFNDGRFKKFQDENTEVSFLLGFSPMGMRAFQVRRGAVEGGRREDLAADFDSRRGAIDTDDQTADPQWIASHVKLLTRDQIKDLAYGLVSARSQWGAQITVSELQNIVEASLGIDSISRQLGFDNFEALLRSFGDFTFESHGDYCYLGIAAATKVEEPEATCGAEEGPKLEEPPILGWVVYMNSIKKFGYIKDKAKSAPNGPDYWFRFAEAPEVESGRIKKGDLVCFLPSVNDRGLIANKVRLADKTSTKDDAPIGVHKLTEKPSCSSQQPKPYIARPTIEKGGKKGLKSTELGCADEAFLDEVQRYLVQLVKSHGGILNLSNAGIFLNKEYPGSQKIHLQMGFKSLRKMLESFEQITLSNDSPNFSIRVK
jgi:hypothetical protein